MSDLTPNLTHYLETLRFGLVHLPPGTKAPRTNGWQDRPVTTPNEAARVWQHGGGVGIHHAASGTAVLDIDHPEWAVLALAAVDIDLEALLSAPGPKIRGAKGLKPVYLLPEGVELSRKVLTWRAPDADKPATVFELRAGSVQDVLPPSAHPDTGKPYTWEPELPRSRDDIPELPSSLVTLWENWAVLKPVLDRVQPWAAPPAPRRYKEHEGGGVIGAFNAEYSVREVLEQHGYTPKGSDRYLSPHSSTGLAGITILEGDDGFERVYSHHASDPLADGHAHDAFSAWLALEHGGDIKAAVREAAEGLGIGYAKCGRAAPGAEERGGNPGEGVSGADEIIVNRQVREVVDDLIMGLQALELAGNPRIYARADGLLVEMHEGYELEEVTRAESLKALLHDHFEPVLAKEDKSGPYTVPSVFSNNHTALLTRKTGAFPPIKTVSDIPLMLPDGSILLEPGYHKEHGYFLNTAGIEVRLMPPEEARALLLETFNEFSYQAPHAGFTATLAFILQPFLMPVIDDLTPLYAVLGSRRAGSGTGKGYLLDCVYRIHRGRPYTHDGSMPPTNEECGKVLFSALSEGVSHIIFDDIDHLKHRELMAAITSRTYKGRILGVSRRHEVSTQVTWAVSGNAPDIHRDFYRRMVPIYLGIGRARAWERPYSRPDLNRHILEHRNLYISAALSIAEHWRKLGMPLSSRTIQGFDRWSAVMGGVLEAAGFPHLLEARDGLDELIEVDNGDLDLLIDAWQGCSLADEKLRCKSLLRLAQDRELLTELYDGRSEAAGAGELGKFLKPYINDVFGEHYLRREFDSDSKTWRYFLEPVPDAPKLLSDVFTFAPLETSAQHPRSTPVKDTNAEATGVSRGSSGHVLREDDDDDSNQPSAREGEDEDAEYL